ncbi:MAG: dienelactone hydrolase family protein [Alphaproteobacteria bacterium]|nr:dienelactone hydrolase family protein [Alphaproteobacteria bacterium]
MIEEQIGVDTGDGVMNTFLVRPEDGGPYAPVVVFMDIWGVREQLRDIARTIAAVGYAVAVPNLYYRMGDIQFDYRNPDGTTASLKDLPEDEQKRLQEIWGQVTDPMAVADAGALIDHLGRDDGIDTSLAGSVGYCMGGRHVLRVAAAYPDRFRATASLHPTRLVVEGRDSPHRDAGNVRGAYYTGFGETDHYTPPEVIAGVRAAFNGQPADYADTVHKGAAHGYAIPDRDVYDKHAAFRDWEIIFAMYDRVLRGRDR